MNYKVYFNSGLSFEDTTCISVEASSKQEALELALAQNPEFVGFQNYVS